MKLTALTWGFTNCIHVSQLLRIPASENLHNTLLLSYLFQIGQGSVHSRLFGIISLTVNKKYCKIGCPMHDQLTRMRNRFSHQKSPRWDKNRSLDCDVLSTVLCLMN